MAAHAAHAPVRREPGRTTVATKSGGRRNPAGDRTRRAIAGGRWNPAGDETQHSRKRRMHEQAARARVTMSLPVLRPPPASRRGRAPASAARWGLCTDLRPPVPAQVELTMRNMVDVGHQVQRVQLAGCSWLASKYQRQPKMVAVSRLRHPRRRVPGPWAWALRPWLVSCDGCYW